VDKERILKFGYYLIKS